MKVKNIDILKEGKLLPPPPDHCQKCAVKHHPSNPHNQNSMFWKYWFKKEYGRWPTWGDAMEHCPDKIKKRWIEALKEYGFKVEEIDFPP